MIKTCDPPWNVPPGGGGHLIAVRPAIAPNSSSSAAWRAAQKGSAGLHFLFTQQHLVRVVVTVECHAAPVDALGHQEAGRRQLRVRAPLREVRAQDLARQHTPWNRFDDLLSED